MASGLMEVYSEGTEGIDARCLELGPAEVRLWRWQLLLFRYLPSTCSVSGG